ncbi:MAG: hypothetical protein Q9219_002563 [cf. Caloplaca sp. 3 TL-2023]
MAEVLSFPSHLDGPSRFGSSSLQRSSSHSSLLMPDPTIYAGPSNSQPSGYSRLDYDNRPSNSLPSSAPSSPRLSQTQFSNQPSYTSTPSSSLSLDEDCSLHAEDVQLPSYGDETHAVQDLIASPPNSPDASSSGVRTPSDDVFPGPGPSTMVPASAGASSSAGDDMNLNDEPTRHVDYLSHNWKEEDIWSSWKHVVARRQSYSNSTRLENASWRTWAKSKYRLKTVSPETLNWMKDHDVTWLYGPLQSNSSRRFSYDSASATDSLSRANPFASKKPILKKRSLSELMLQKSISSSTLIQQATDALQAQQPGRGLQDGPVMRQRALSDSIASSIPETPSSPSIEGVTSTQTSTSTSGRQTPCTKRHIHFNNKVEQCIAINDGDHRRCKYGRALYEDSDSDDDMLMMKPTAGKAKPKSASTPRNNFSNENKTIAMLPSTTLKYRGDTPDPIRQQEKQKGGSRNNGFKIPQSASQETIKPSMPSSNFLLDDEDEEMDMSWQPSPGRRDSIFMRRSHPDDQNSDEKEGPEERNGLRRTPSGMFMPYDDDDNHTTGLLGKVIDTVNTAKDIAHVIWNVGWRG